MNMNAMSDPLAPVKCLLVDDLEENLYVLSTLLRGSGVELLQARSGSEALELLLVHDVALALLDVQMPDMDGFELAELIRGREQTRDIPIIFITAGEHDARRLFKGYETGAVDFLYKPIEPHILRNKAEVFFQIYRQKQQLARELRERTESLRLNEMFTAVLGHDLRNPLASVLMGAQVLALNGDEKAAVTARRIEGSARRMARMIDQLLDLARLRSSGLQLQTQPADMTKVCEAIAEELRRPGEPARVRISASGNGQGVFDVDRMSQVVSNLVGNALEHGAAESEVEIAVDGSAGKTLTVRVTNRGAIAAEEIPTLFDPFKPGRGERPGRGLGLGLYIAERFVKMHGGTLRVGTGVQGADVTVMEFSLPRHVDAAAVAPQMMAAAPDRR